MPCIKLGEPATFVGGKVFEKPAAPAALAAVKARQEAVQLWGRGSLAILNLPRICRTCRICPRRDRFRDEPDAPEQPASVGLVRLSSEGLPHGVVESACADGAEAVERAVFHGVGDEVAEHGSSVFGLGLSWPSELLCDYSGNCSSASRVGAFPDPPLDDGIAASAGAGASRSALTGIRPVGGGFRLSILVPLAAFSRHVMLSLSKHLRPFSYAQGGRMGQSKDPALS